MFIKQTIEVITNCFSIYVVEHYINLFPKFQSDRIMNTEVKPVCNSRTSFPNVHMRAVPLAALLIKMDSQKSQIHTHTQANRKRERERNRDSHRETVVLSVDGDAVGPSVDCCRQPFMHSLIVLTHSFTHSFTHSVRQYVQLSLCLSVMH